MFGETFWGLFSIAVAIFAGFFFFWFTIRKPVEDFLQEMKRSQVDEKIATLYGYASVIETWRKDGVNVELATDRIATDLRAILRIKKAIVDDQKERLNNALREVNEAMKRAGYEKQIGKVEDVASLLN